ncbi:uncharacterized protein LOC123530577 isoform X2 [Mercenaria mercenaria]|uniref:uncharacterized protein LOC123530577 isoform X2 n=1 Tax=Mercenaria mercenaria TaxID=6596 RepID=UPI00234E7892|nr:uncharacterized protein LOC123530577 isoform X2 [Mercenaria mercenaria]
MAFFLNDLDFLELGAFSEVGNNEEDILLSQALDTFEKSPVTDNCKTESRSSDEIFSTTYDDVKLSQALDSLEKSDLFVSNLTNTQYQSIVDGVNVSTEEFGDFSVDIQLQPEPWNYACGDPVKSHFGNVETSEVDSLVSEQKAKNTTRSTRWAVSVFEAWRSEMKMRGEHIPEIQVRHQQPPLKVYC